jgi:hypothetical protein
VYQQHGWEAYWRARSKILLTTSPEPCRGYEIGVGYLRVNELGPAFDLFNQAVDRHCFYMALIRVDPLFDAVRHDPRYNALLKRIRQ